MTTHDDTLARAQALRESVGGYYTALGPHLPESITAVLADHLDDVLTRHEPFRIYEECDHEHTDDDVASGVAVDVDGVGYICRDGYQGTICCWCCMDSQTWREQSERCATYHDHSERQCPDYESAVRLLEALDGGFTTCPTCQRGQVRETVGLVCQTCGTDYGSGEQT